MAFVEMKFSPETLPQGDPIEAMKEYVGRQLIRLDIDLPDEDSRLEYHLDLHVSDTVQWGRWTTLPVRYERSGALLEDGNDDVMAAIVDEPILMTSPGMEDFIVEPGEMLLFSQARRFSYTLPRASQGISMRLPRSVIKSALPSFEEAPLRVISKEAPGQNLLRAYLHATVSERFDQAAACNMAGQHLHELVSYTISPQKDRAAELREGTLSSARYKTVEADMIANLARPHLNLEWIAARHGVSVRHVQRLFSARGTSFSDELRRLRLERAAGMLSNARYIHRTILSIALDLGFADAPAFNRSFKRHFGITPGELRRTRK